LRQLLGGNPKLRNPKGSIHVNNQQHLEVLREMKDAMNVQVKDLLKKYYDTNDARLAQLYRDKASGLEAAIKVVDDQITTTHRYIDN
jgi:basic membrane lipoprotein Med (substrate-binding protein (PBP1-ABC) superfamily)